ncbi:MAG: tetratricopeptide repeat protein [Treponema sp.]|nr:tetratricopeptide repeat protein [Treponema sp.]
MAIRNILKIKKYCALAGLLLLLLPVALSFLSCITSDAKAEEYYAIGDAYLELKKYIEAETWFNKAKFNKSTKMACEYNLGRIAYETGRYRAAAEYFEHVIKADGENIAALRAAAYTYIKLEKPEKAVSYYRIILDLVPESYDEGYNYALVLMALGEAEEAERILVKFNNTESPEALLVLARSRRRQGKAEAADAYNNSLLKQDNPLVRAEYAAYLAEVGLPAKALEEYRKVLENGTLSEEKKEEIEKAVEQLKTDA